MEGVEDGRLTGVEGLGTLTLFLKVDQSLVPIGGREIADRDNGAIANPLLRQATAQGIDRRRACKTDVHNRTAFKINAIEEAAVSGDGSHPGREQQTRQSKEVLGLAPPI